VTVIIAEANGESEQLRGVGDAEVNRIFAEAYGEDPDFFAFYRSMLAYQQGLQSSDTRLLITPDSEFFRYFNDPAGRGPSAPGDGGTGSGFAMPAAPAPAAPAPAQ
jgi:membrane protease subunit HflC